jgi:glycoprotein-N-acetylgalactosamine 3-beta-galactosyltransferase
MDNSYQKRFFPIPIIHHFDENFLTEKDWYPDYLWYNNTMGGLDCCSDTFCSLHYVEANQMHELEYLIYHVHPFGLDKNSTEKLPRKLGLKEIIATSDTKGWGKEFFDHEPVHNLDPSEFY